MIKLTATYFDVDNTPFAQNKIDNVLEYMREAELIVNDGRDYFLKGDLICVKDNIGETLADEDEEDNNDYYIDLKNDVISLIEFMVTNKIDMFVIV